MFLRDKVVARKIKVPNMSSDDGVRITMKSLGFEDTEAKNANVLFAVSVGSDGEIVHARAVTWSITEVSDVYYLQGDEQTGGHLVAEDVWHVFIQVEATIGEVTATAYTQT